MGGNIRVWYNDFEDETSFGKKKDIVYEIRQNEKYIKIAV